MKGKRKKRVGLASRKGPVPLTYSFGQARCGCSWVYNNMLYKLAALEAASLSRRRSASC